MQEEVKTASDAIDLLADQGLIKCKRFCKFFATLHDKVLNDPIWRRRTRQGCIT